MAKLDGKTAIVSGSGPGIGRSIALKLAAEGANVVVNDLDTDPAEDVVAEITKAVGNAAICAGSVTAEGFGERFVGTAISEFGGLDIIINNAGYTWDSVIQKMGDDQWDAILDVHLLAAAQMMIPLGRPGTPDEAAGSVVMLTYPEADYVSGQILVTGGRFEA